MSAILLLLGLLAAGHIEAKDPSEYKVDLLYIVDGSSSVTEDDPAAWNHTLKFMQDFAAALTVGSGRAKVAMVKYGDVATTEFNLNQYTTEASLLPAIGNVHMPGGELVKLYTAQTVLTGVYLQQGLDRLLTPDVALVITNGMKNYDPSMTGLVSKIFQLTGVKFFVVCILDGCSQATAQEIASPPITPTTQTSFYIDSYADLENVRVPVLTQLGTIPGV